MLAVLPVTMIGKYRHRCSKPVSDTALPTVRLNEAGSARLIVSTSVPSLRKTLTVPDVPSLGAASKAIDRGASVHTCAAPLEGCSVVAAVACGSAALPATRISAARIHGSTPERGVGAESFER